MVDDESKRFPNEDEDDALRRLPKEDDDESGSSSSTDTTTGGAQGQIEFHDFLAPTDNLRDDLLSPEEKKRLLSIHKDNHEWHVKKQKDLRDARRDLKEGKKTYKQYIEQGYGRGNQGNLPRHPILADKAQFSGIDKQESPVPADNVAETNPENRNELELQYRLTHTPEFTARPRFNPKLQR